IIARPDVQRVSFDIDRRRVPDGTAGRAIQLRAGAVFHCWHGRLRDGVGLPEAPSIFCIQRDDASSKRTTWVPWIADLRLLARRNRNIEAAIVKLRRRR